MTDSNEKYGVESTDSQVGMIGDNNRVNGGIHFHSYQSTPEEIKEKKSTSRSSNDSETFTQKNRWLLPYLVDRRQQVDCLDKAVNTGNKPGSPKICLVHGDETQCLEEFIQCLQHRYWQEFEPRNRSMAVPKLILLDWPYFLDNEQEISDRIIKDISSLLPRELHFSDNIFDAVNKSHNGALLICTFTSSNRLKHKKEIVEQFINFWSSWPSRGAGGVFVSCLVIKYSHKKEAYTKKFFDMFYRIFKNNSDKLTNQDIRDILNVRHSQCLVPELEGIEKDHADAWTRLHEVQEICIKKNLQPGSIIREIFKNQEIISMETLAKELKTKFLTEESGN
ncbi:hypothetical protein QUF70_03930 [Desulfobacterales bacterium HSG17]|nr:hypothetical protein [Desulfobacterales bacterium HSG17]